MKRFGLLLLGALATVYCGGDGGGPPTITAVVVAGDSTVVIAGTRQFTATAMAGSTPVSTGVTFQWTSSDTTRATVAGTGLVSGVRLGTTSITARAVVNGTPTTVSSSGHAIRVRIGSISFLPTALQFSSLGDTAQLSVVARDALNAPMGGVTFTLQSRTPSVATATLIDPNTANVVAIANGTARIVATGDGISDSLIATVQQVAQALSITPDTVTFGRIDSVLNPIITASDARGNAIPASGLSWGSQATAVATVNPVTGAITSKNEGQSRVIATSGSHVDTVRVGVALIYKSVDIATGGGVPSPIDSAVITRLTGSLQLGLIVRDSGNTVVPNPQGITWSLKTGTIADIGAATGLLTGNTNTGRDTVVVVARTVRDSVPLIVRQDVATIAVTPALPAVLNFVSDTQRFAAEARDGSGAAIPGKVVTWSTSRGILGIDATGLAHADSATSQTGVLVNVRAATDGVTDSSVSIRVRQIPDVATLSPSSFPALTAFGRQATASCVVQDSAAVTIPNHACTWDASPSGVITFNPTLAVTTTITAVGNGNATITATAFTNVFGPNSIQVDQIPASVAITPEPNLAGTPQLRTSQTLPFYAVVRDSLGNIAAQDTVTWSIHTGVVSVNPTSGLVTTSAAPGTDTVTATAGPASASRVVAVSATAVSYSTNVSGVLVTSCVSAGCHNAVSQLAGLNLEAASSYGELVDIASSEVPALRRVRPFRPDSSFMVHKIQGTQSVGLKMPEGCPGTRPCLPNVTIDIIRNWILQGAQNN